MLNEEPFQTAVANEQVPSAATSSTASASWIQDHQGTKTSDSQEKVPATTLLEQPSLQLLTQMTSTQEALLSSIASRLTSLETTLIPDIVKELMSQLHQDRITTLEKDDKAQKRKFQDMMTAQTKAAKEAIDLQCKAAKGTVEAYGKTVREWIGREC